jgi:hypothetical protein
MQRKILAASILLVALIGAASAQGGADGATGWRPSASFTPWGQGSADLDGGGSFRASGALLRVGVGGDMGGGNQAGVRLSYDRIDYRFSAPGGQAPWDDVGRIGLGAQFVFRGAGGWSYLLSPSAGYSLEDGAKPDDALVYGALAAAVKRFDADRTIGIGLGVFDQVGKVRAQPVLFVDWKLSERLRLANPLAAGPTGGGGLELSTRFDGGWTLGAGAAYRTLRFRLREDGPFPDGVGEERGAVGFVRAGRRIGREVRLDLYAGAVFAGQLKAENANGEAMLKRGFDPAPLLGATLSLGF